MFLDIFSRKRIRLLRYLAPSCPHDTSPKGTAPKQEHRWRIVRITHTPAKLVGHVYAPDEDAALRRTVEQFGIQKPWRNRLLALREN